MTLESPMLALCLLPVALLALWATDRHWPTAGKWLLRGTILLLLAAVAGPVVRWQRPLKVVVMVDVSPSTRGASFRDSRSVEARLTPLLAGQAYRLHYFADGEQPTETEPSAVETRLTAPPDADALLLLSDGRLKLSGTSPPIYPVIDPTLDAPGDAAVRSIRPLPLRQDSPGRFDAGRFAVEVLGQPGRVLHLGNAKPGGRRLPAGPVTIEATADDRLTAEIEPGDRWPENDALTGFAPVRPNDCRSYEITVAGFRDNALATVPVDPMSWVNVSAIAVRGDLRLSAAQERAIDQYVRTLGGTLLLVGEPAATGTLEKLSPLSVRPVEGPAACVVLIDASGSMAGPAAGLSKWQTALTAAASAVDRLPKDARVTVLRFASTVQPIASDASPAAAMSAIRAAAADVPSGRTGLRSALQAAVDAAGRVGGARVLLLTDGEGDLGDTQSLSASFRTAKATLLALTAKPSPDLKKLCEATGGDATAVDQPTQWNRQFSMMAQPPLHPIDVEERLVGAGPFAGRSMGSDRRWPATVRSGAQMLLTADRQPAAAAWQAGSGRVVAVSAMLSGSDFAELVGPFVQMATDPRFAAEWNEGSDTLTVTAMENGRPMNGLRVTCERGGASVPLSQISPGVYQAKLERSGEASIAILKVNEATEGRVCVAGRYAKEFDDIGNDRAALAELAKRTGGAVIEAGDNRPIPFPRQTKSLPLRTRLAVMAAVVGLITVFVLRRSGSSGSRPPQRQL